MTHDRESKSEAAVRARRRAIALSEALEDVWAEVRADAGASVFDRHFGVAVHVRQLYADATAFGRELDGIGEEVPENLLQAFRVAGDLRGVVESRLKLYLFGARGGAHGLDRRAQDCAKLDAPHVQAHLPRNDARHVEQVVDDLLRRACFALNAFDGARRARRVELARSEQQGPAVDGRQRRPKLVRDRGEEVVLEARSLFG